MLTIFFHIRDSAPIAWLARSKAYERSNRQTLVKGGASLEIIKFDFASSKRSTRGSSPISVILTQDEAEPLHALLRL